MLQVRMKRGGKGDLESLCQRLEHTSFAASERSANSCPWKVHRGWEHCLLLTAKGCEVSCLRQPVLGIVLCCSSSEPPAVHSAGQIPVLSGARLLREYELFQPQLHSFI